MKRIILKIWHGIEFLFEMLLYFISFPIAFILYGRKKYWLISEVNFDARDNGLWLFKYLNQEHKDDVNSIYLISKKNPNYKMVSGIGETLEPRSYKHLLIFIAAKYKISTLVHGCSHNGYLTILLTKIHGTGKNIALKHGVFKNLHPNYFKKNAHLDLICCGAKPEFEFINSEFGYDKGVAQYTGLARFDGLNDIEVKKQVLIMPTWRRWLDSINTIEELKESDFYKNWCSILTSKYITNELTDRGYSICFYVHPKLNKFVDAFSELNNKVLFLNSKNGDDVQRYLKESALLLTDFSSIFFDFAYMRKPSIYYQFDEAQYYDNHYIKAYFDYRKDGFGDVCVNQKEVEESFKKILDNNFIIDNDYSKRIDEFFIYRDNNNCERIYDAIINLK